MDITYHIEGELSEETLQAKLNNFTIFKALAGCGKTHAISLNANKWITEEDFSILLLSVHSNNVDILRKVIINSEKCTFNTLHAFARGLIQKSGNYKILEKIDELLESEDKQKDKIAYHMMIDIAIEDFEHFKNYINEDILIIDEVQDLEGKVFEFVILLFNLFKSTNRTIVIAGDDNQKIISNEKKNNCKGVIEKLTALYSDCNIIPLQDNRRFLNGAIAPFVNSLLEYFNQTELFTEKECDFYELPQIYTFGDKEDQIAKIYETIIENHKIGKTLKVITNTKREKRFLIRKFNEFCIKNMLAEEFVENELFTSIHKFKGMEADVIIISNMYRLSKPWDKLKANLLYVAVTRAREKLLIFTTFPKKEIIALVDPERYELIDYQTEFKKSKQMEKEELLNKYYKIESVLKNGKALLDEFPITREMVIYPRLDYLLVQLDMDDYLPFIPYEIQSSKKKVIRYKTESMKNIGEFEYFIKRTPGKIGFDFGNLSLLKGMGMSDLDILEFASGIIHEYFDGRLPPEGLKHAIIKRVDIAHVFSNGNPILQFQTLEDILLVKKRRPKTGIILNLYDTGSHHLLADNFQKGLNIVMYQPKFKPENKNPILGILDSDLKLELRLADDYSKLTFEQLESMVPTLADYYKNIIEKSINPFKEKEYSELELSYVPETKDGIMEIVKSGKRYDISRIAVKYFKKSTEDEKNFLQTIFQNTPK